MEPPLMLARRLRAGLAGVCLLTSAAGIAGAGIAVGSLTGSGEPREPGVPGIGEATRISYGYLAVQSARIAPAAVAAPRGQAGDRIAMQASVTLANATQAVQPHTPDDFRLRTTGAGARRWLRPVHASVAAGSLQPDAAIETRLTFLAPRGTAPAELSFHDPGAAAPVRVTLDDQSRSTPGARSDHG